MKNTLITLGLVGATLLAGGGLMQLNAQKEIGTLPVEQVLKVDVADILASSESDGVVQYEYVSTKLKPAEKLSILDEDMSKRTKNSQTWKTGIDVNDNPVYHTRIYSGDTFYKKGSDWYQVDYATTTKESYDLQVSTPLSMIKRAWAAVDFINASNYRVEGYSSVSYATARGTANFSNTILRTGQEWDGANWIVDRGFLKFDTSSIGAGTTIASVALSLSILTGSDQSATDFDVQIIKYDWSANDPITSGNRDTAYDACLAGTADDNIWRNTNGVSVTTAYTSGALNTAWVSKTGTTYYCLASSRDRESPNGTTPTGAEYVIFAPLDDATVSLRPTLIVTYAGDTVATPDGDYNIY